MAGIRLSEIGNAIAYKGVPWAKGGKASFTIKRQSFPKGSVPRHLAPFTGRLAAVARECAQQTRGTSGSARIDAMNACVSARLRRGG